MQGVESPIRILLANPQPILRSGLRSLLEREPEFRVVAEAASASEAIVLTDFKHPDIVLLEIKFHDLTGTAVAKQLSSRQQVPKLVFVTDHTDAGYVMEAFKAGAAGYVAWDTAITDLPRAIRVVIRGRCFLSPSISAHLLDAQAATGNISNYDKDLWSLTAAGYEEDEIAGMLNTHISKVRTDRQSFKSVSFLDALPEAITKSLSARLMSNIR